MKAGIEKADKNTIVNLEKLESHTNNNFEELYKKVRHFENSTMALFNEKESVLGDLDYRLSKIEKTNEKAKESIHSKENSENLNAKLINQRINEL